jgi:hypothetical protein
MYVVKLSTKDRNGDYQFVNRRFFIWKSQNLYLPL